MNPILSDVKPDDLVDHLITIRHLLPTTAKERIVKAFSTKSQMPLPDTDQDKDINLYDEIKKQFYTASKIRDALDKLPPEAILGREATSALTSVTSLLSLAHKIMSELQTMKRVNVIETAITDAMEGQSDEVKKKFTRQLATLLGTLDDTHPESKEIQG